MEATNPDDIGLSRRLYRPLLELGRGGMAKVYLAESLASGVRKLVVLKVLNRELASEPEMRAAFRREAELSARMNHPNVVQVSEVVEHTGVPVIVMEYLDGVALSRVVQHVQAELPLRLHLHILTQVLAGLHHFHELTDFDGNSLQAVHRDVSPQNVLVLHDGIVKVVDFGIAKVNAAPDQHTRAGMIKGKIHYMPPEQLLGETGIDRRADLFSVGVMLWEAIANRRMWDGFSETRVLRQLARGELPSLRETVPDVPESLEHIVNRALNVDREKRYGTAQEMLIELEQVMAEREGHVQPRELSAFMAKHFGDRRQYQQRTIEKALRNPASTLSGVMECKTAPPAEVGSSSFRANFETLPQPTTQAAVSRAWKPLLVGVAVAGAIAASVAFLSSASKPAPAASAAEPARAVQVRITTEPPDAEIRLDGVKLGVGRYDGQMNASAKEAVLEVRATGHRGSERKVSLASDVSLSIQLEREPAAALAQPSPPPVSSAAPADGRTAVVDTVSARARLPSRAFKPARAPAGAVPAAAAAPAPAAAAAANCNPPYRLSPDGVKLFKPECF